MDFIVQYGSLIGVAALIAVLINIGKVIGWVKEETAKTWSALLNLAFLVAFVLLKVFAPDFSTEMLDEQAAELAKVAAFVLAYVVQLGSSTFTHMLVRGIPLIGKSFSYDREVK